jgi:hypothetical protein
VTAERAIKHGTRWAYQGRGCKCAACREANNVASRASYAKRTTGEKSGSGAGRQPRGGARVRPARSSAAVCSDSGATVTPEAAAVFGSAGAVGGIGVGGAAMPPCGEAPAHSDYLHVDDTPAIPLMLTDRQRELAPTFTARLAQRLAAAGIAAERVDHDPQRGANGRLAHSRSTRRAPRLRRTGASSS